MRLPTEIEAFHLSNNQPKEPMNYTEIAKAEGLNDRQQSLFNILDAAVHAAKHEGEEPLEIVVIRAPLHVDEYVDSEHVYAPKMAVEAGLIYKKRPGFEWQIDAVVGPTGSVFYTDTADALVVLKHTQESERRVDFTLV